MSYCYRCGKLMQMTACGPCVIAEIERLKNEITRLESQREQDVEAAFREGWRQALAAISHRESTTIHEAFVRFQASRKGGSE